MLFDTLELSWSLQPSFTPEQAEALVQALGKSQQRPAGDQSHIAGPKAENATLKADFHGEVSTLRPRSVSRKNEQAQLAARRLSALADDDSRRW